MRYHDDEKLRKLAGEICEGRIFTSNGVPPDLMQMVFMPLAMSDQATIDKMKTDKVVVLYEYLDLAGPQGINGYPMFMSFRSLTEEDYAALMPIYEKMKAAIDLAKAGG